MVPPPPPPPLCPSSSYSSSSSSSFSSPVAPLPSTWTLVRDLATRPARPEEEDDTVSSAVPEGRRRRAGEGEGRGGRGGGAATLSPPPSPSLLSPPFPVFPMGFRSARARASELFLRLVPEERSSASRRGGGDGDGAAFRCGSVAAFADDVKRPCIARLARARARSLALPGADARRYCSRARARARNFPPSRPRNCPVKRRAQG